LDHLFENQGDDGDKSTRNKRKYIPSSNLKVARLTDKTPVENSGEINDLHSRVTTIEEKVKELIENSKEKEYLNELFDQQSFDMNIAPGSEKQQESPQKARMSMSSNTFVPPQDTIP